MSGYCVENSLMIVTVISAVLGTTFCGLNFEIIVMNCGPRVDILETNFRMRYGVTHMIVIIAFEKYLFVGNILA